MHSAMDMIGLMMKISYVSQSKIIQFQEVPKNIKIKKFTKCTGLGWNN